MDTYSNKAPGNGRFFVDFLFSPGGVPALNGLFILFVLLIVLLLVGCSSSDPEIMQVDLKIVASLSPPVNSDGLTTQVTEYLQVRMDVHDPDGNDEVAGLAIIHDASGLFWETDIAGVRTLERDGQNWLSFDALPVPGSQRVPRGVYRVEVEDLSGRRGVRTVTLPFAVPAAEPADFVRVVADRVALPGGGESGTDSTPRMYLYSGGDESPAVALEEISVSAMGGSTFPVSAVPVPSDQRAEDRRLWFVVERGRYLRLRSGPW